MTLEELHVKLFEVLCLVDDICKKENVRYFLDGGTEIGSVREKTIIPWDDDLDIKVLREDYSALKAALKKHLPEGWRLIEPRDMAPAFYDFVPRVVNEKVLLREVTDKDRYYHNYQNMLGVDIFILDKAPDSPVSQKLLLLGSKIIYGMAMSKRYSIDWSTYSFLQKIYVGVLTVLGTPFSIESILSMQEYVTTKWQQKKTAFRFPSNYLLRDMQIHREQWYSGIAHGELYGRKFPIPKGFDEELKLTYGDYMRPPKDPSIYIQHM